MAEVTHSKNQSSFEEIRLTASDITIRKISLNDLWQSLREGYEDFGAKPGSMGPLLILFYGFSALLVTWFSLGQEFRYLAFPVVAGFTLFGPMVAIVFFEMSRLRESGQEMRFRSAFRFIHTSSFAPLLALSLVMLVLYLGWLYMADLIYFGLFGKNSPASFGEFMDQLFSTRRGAALILYGNAVGFLFAFAAMAISVVSFALALDKPVTSLTAMAVSIRAFISNIYVLMVWGVVVVLLLAIGAALFLIGLAVVLPVLGHTTWHLYEKIIES